MKRTLPLCLLFGTLLLTFGCADPAADAPQAEVAEPAAEPAAAPAMEGARVYGFSDDSTVSFVGSKVTGAHDGGFESFDGTIAVADGTVEGSSVEVVIDTTSLWTDTERLTGHLKSADFFEVETYPTATFRSSSITPNDDGTYTVTGNLDLHGVTKQISFPATVALTEDGFTAEAEFAIKRYDFGIEYPGKPDDLIRDDVLVKLDLRSGELASMDEEMTEPDETEG